MKKNFLKIAFLVLGALLISTLNTNAQLNFAATVNYGVGTSPKSVCSADFNGDGKMDLATANSGTGQNSVAVLLGSGTGTFSPALYSGVGNTPYSVCSADFNGDGKMDLAAANVLGNNVSILLGNGTGYFAPAVNYGTANRPYSVFSTDFNGDGKMDLATANRLGNNVSILLGSGTGTFAPAVNYAVDPTPQSVFSADFNGDGKMDIATANTSASSVSILLGSGTGTFAPVVNYFLSSFTNPESIFSADFNGDGKMDLATANSGGSNVSILLGSGNGTFASAVNYPVGSSADLKTIFSADFNSDGKMDLVTADYAGTQLGLLLGSGNGTFAPFVNYGVGAYPASVISADFNGDAKMDLATANYGGNNASILLNTSIIPGAALNFDGAGDYVNLGSGISSAVSSGTAITIEYWFKGTEAHSAFRIQDPSLNYIVSAWSNPPRFIISTDGGVGSGVFCGPTATVYDGNWHHMACVWEKNKIMATYLDGALQDSRAAANVNLPIISANALLGSNQGGSEYTNGSIDEMRVWNRALCQGEIQNNMNGELSLPQTGLVAYYKFNQGLASAANPTITTAINELGATNTGTLTSFALTSTTSNWVAPGAVVSGNTVTAFVNPIITVSGANAICLGSSATLTASGVSTYTWSGGPNTANYAVSPIVNTTYSVVGTTNGCVSNMATKTLTVNANPTITVNSGAICYGNSFTITPSGANTYTIQGGNNIVSPSSNSTYTVSGTSADGCIGNVATSNVVVNDINTLTFTTVVSCNGGSNGSATINANGGTPNYAFSWAPSGGTGATATGLSAGSYTCTVTDANACTKTQVATITEPAVLNVTAVQSSTAICQGAVATITLNANGGTPAYTGTGTFTSNVATTNYTVTDANGCVSSSVINLTINATPTISVNSGAICYGNSFTITPSGADTYTVEGGNTIVSPSSNSSYTVTGTDVNGCVGNTAASNVTVNTLPTVVATTNNTLICTGETASLTATGATSYIWNTSATTAVIAVSPTTTTSYTVNGVDANGCENNAIVTQSVSLCTGDLELGMTNAEFVVFPNPSNGILNIEFSTPLEPTSNTAVKITNALGQVVIVSPLQGDGRGAFNIQAFPAGIYFVTVTQNGASKTIKLIKE
jgi:hypothetical protein